MNETDSVISHYNSYIGTSAICALISFMHIYKFGLDSMSLLKFFGCILIILIMPSI